MIEIGFFIIGLSWLVPNSSYPWLGFWMDTVASIGFLCTLFVFLQFKKIILSAYLILLVIFFTAFLLIDFSFRGGYFGDYFVGMFFLLIFLLSVLIGENLENQYLKDAFSTAILIAAILSALLAIAQLFEINLSSAYFRERHYGTRTFANAGQPNNFGTMLSFGVVALYTIRRKFSTLSFVIILLIISLAAASTQSRTSILQFICISLILIIIYFKEKVFKLKIESVLPLILIFTSTIIVSKAKEILQITSERNITEIGIKNSRFDYWNSMLEAIFQKPITGYGWLRNAEAQLIGTTETTKEAIFQYSHNLFIDIIVWFGIPAALIAIFLMLKISYDALSSKIIDEKLNSIGFLIFLIHCMLEYPFAYLHLLIPAGIYLGISLQTSGSNKALPRPVYCFVIMTSLLMTFIIFKEYRSNESIVTELRFRNLNIGAFNASPIVHENLFLDQLSSWIKASYEKPLDSENLSTENYEKAALRYGTEKLLFHRHLAYRYKGDMEKSKESIKFICKVNTEEICGKYKDYVR